MAACNSSELPENAANLLHKRNFVNHFFCVLSETADQCLIFAKEYRIDTEKIGITEVANQGQTNKKDPQAPCQSGKTAGMHKRPGVRCGPLPISSGQCDGNEPDALRSSRRIQGAWRAHDLQRL
jgi:hypothetical protein